MVVNVVVWQTRCNAAVVVGQCVLLANPGKRNVVMCVLVIMFAKLPGMFKIRILVNVNVRLVLLEAVRSRIVSPASVVVPLISLSNVTASAIQHALDLKYADPVTVRIARVEIVVKIPIQWFKILMIVFALVEAPISVVEKGALYVQGVNGRIRQTIVSASVLQ